MSEVKKDGAVPQLFHIDYRHDGHTASLSYQSLLFY